MVDPLHTQQRNVMEGLREAHQQLQRDEAKVVSLVAAAREHGVPWSSIGDVLGVSKQAAWERYGRTDAHPARSRTPEQD